MNALLGHVWGISPAQDRVWAQVAGYAPSNVGRGLMVFQAAIDESYNDGGPFVLAGYIATAETWAAFSKDWELLLPLTLPCKESGKRRFKMKEMARPQRIGNVPAFYSVIEKYDLLRVSCHFDLATLENAKQRVWVDNLNIDWGYTDNPYTFAFRCLMDMFHNNRALLDKVISPGEKVDFYFDERKERKAINAMWEEYIRLRPDEVKQYYGINPRFEDDEEFLPLQAADFWAWWVRRWYRNGTPEKIEFEDFGSWKASKTPKGVAITFNEDQITQFFIEEIRRNIEPGRPVFDAKYHPRPIEIAKSPEVKEPSISFFAWVKRLFS